MKLRKKFKAQTGSQQVLEKQCKALQELCGKQRLEVDALRDDASQSGQSCPLATITSCICITTCRKITTGVWVWYVLVFAVVLGCFTDPECCIWHLSRLQASHNLLLLLDTQASGV